MKQYSYVYLFFQFIHCNYTKQSLIKKLANHKCAFLKNLPEFDFTYSSYNRKQAKHKNIIVREQNSHFESDKILTFPPCGHQRRLAPLARLVVGDHSNLSEDQRSKINRGDQRSTFALISILAITSCPLEPGRILLSYALFLSSSSPGNKSLAGNEEIREPRRQHGLIYRPPPLLGRSQTDLVASFKRQTTYIVPKTKDQPNNAN